MAKRNFVLAAVVDALLEERNPRTKPRSDKPRGYGRYNTDETTDDDRDEMTRNPQEAYHADPDPRP